LELGIVIISVIVPEISISGLGVTLPFPVAGHCRNSQSLGDTFFRLSMVEKSGLAVGISTLSVVFPVV